MANWSGRTTRALVAAVFVSLAPLSACFAATAAGGPAAAPASPAATAPAGAPPALEFTLGYSPFFVDPHAGMRLSGLTGEARWDFGSDSLAIFSKGCLKRRELALSFATVLEGDIDASAIGLTYGRRYDFDHLYAGFGFAPFTYILIPRGAAQLEPGYTLDGGPRLAVYYLLGSRFFLTERFGLAIDVKFYFTVRNVYWHDPFAPHVHKDMFNSFVFGVGLIRRGG
jgi:hypothetical protein